MPGFARVPLLEDSSVNELEDSSNVALDNSSATELEDSSNVALEDSSVIGIFSFGSSTAVEELLQAISQPAKAVHSRPT